MNKVTIALTALVVVFAAALGYFLWLKPKDKPIYAPMPSMAVMKLPAKHDSTGARQVLAKTDTIFERYRGQLIERDQKLSAQLAALANRGAEADSLKAEIDRMRSDYDTLAMSLTSWQKAVADSVEAAKQHGGEPQLPPMPDVQPATQQNSTESSGGASGPDMEAMVSLATAGLCVAQPELCPVALAIGPLLAALFGGGDKDAYQLVKAFAKAGGIPDSSIDMAERIVKSNPNLAKAARQLVDSAAAHGLVSQEQKAKVDEAVKVGTTISDNFSRARERYVNDGKAACDTVVNDISGGKREVEKSLAEAIRNLTKDDTGKRMFKDCDLGSIGSRVAGESGR